MEYYSSYKKEWNADSCSNLTDTLLSDIAEPQKDNNCMIPIIHGTQNSQVHRDRKGLREGEKESYSLVGMEFPFGKMKQF